MILLGHGSRSGIRGLSREDLENIPNAKILWIYACECGLGLIHSLANSQYAVLGYITEVLAPASIESTVAYKIKEIIEAYPHSSDAKTVVHHVQTALFRFAVKLVAMSRSKEKNMSLLLFQAALVNHTRLGLRIGNPLRHVVAGDGSKNS